VLTDPLSVTYNSVAKSLARNGSDDQASVYRTADGEFEVYIQEFVVGDITRIEIKLNRVIPDPTPSDAFDAFRRIVNSFGFTYEFDTLTRAESGVDIPRLRTALIALVDSTLQGRLIAGEK